MIFDQPLHRVGEVARELRVSADTVYRALESGELRGLKIGTGPRAQWRIPADAIQEWTAAPNR